MQSVVRQATGETQRPAAFGVRSRVVNIQVFSLTSLYLYFLTE